MKFWKLHIYFEDNGTIIQFPKKLSLKEMDGIAKLIAGGSHVHRDPRRKPKSNPIERMPKTAGSEPGSPYCAPMGGKGD